MASSSSNPGQEDKKWVNVPEPEENRQAKKETAQHNKVVDDITFPPTIPKRAPSPPSEDEAAPTGEKAGKKGFASKLWGKTKDKIDKLREDGKAKSQGKDQESSEGSAGKST